MFLMPYCVSHASTARSAALSKVSPYLVIVWYCPCEQNRIVQKDRGLRPDVTITVPPFQ